MTFLNLSIVNVKNFFLQISFRKLKSKYEIILGWSFDVRDCFLCVHRFLEVAVGFCCFEYEKPAKKRFFKLFVISPVQWIAWTQNYFFFNKVTKRDVLARGKKIRFFHECHAIFDFLGKWLLSLFMADHLLVAMDKKNLTALTLLDLSKAFDGLNHNKLLAKLSSVGASPHVVNWFKSYLTGRSQSVRINSILSDPLPITHGVPQGAILSPLLFCIHLNDLPCAPQKCVVLNHMSKVPRSSCPFLYLT